MQQQLRYERRSIIFRLGPFARVQLVALDWASLNLTYACIMLLGSWLEPLLRCVFFDMVAENAQRHQMLDIHDHFKQLALEVLRWEGLVDTA